MIDPVYMMLANEHDGLFGNRSKVTRSNDRIITINAVYADLLESNVPVNMIDENYLENRYGVYFRFCDVCWLKERLS